MKNKRNIKSKANMKMIRNLIIFLGLIVLTFWFIFKDQDLNELLNIVKSANITYVIIGIFLMLLTYLMESYNIRSVLIALGDKKISMLKALKFTWIGFFFSAITPACTGGQPVEIYYMTKEKISGANGTMALLLQLCGFQISTLLIGIVCALFNPYLLKDGIMWLFMLGLGINGLALALMLICIFSKKLTQKLINSLVKILRIFRIKKVDIIKKKLEEGLEKYNESSIFIKTHMGEFVKAVIRVFIQIVIYYSVPFCVYKAFGLNSHSFFQVFSMQAILYTTISGLPLPGSIGVSETVFLKIFGIAFGEKLLNGAMLLSRGINFYLYIIVSAAVVIINAIRTKNIVGEIDDKVIEFEKIELEVQN